MRVPKEEWVRALRRLEGCGDAEIRFNEEVHRWEFVLRGADGIPRAQFWGWFNQPIDPVTGLHPFRELDDNGLLEALENLERTYIANPYNGAGTTRRHVASRYRQNRDAGQKHYKEAGELFAYLASSDNGMGKQIRGATTVSVPANLVGLDGQPLTARSGA